MNEREKLGYERVIFFSDAVFAIAITLLALDVRLPQLPPGTLEAEFTERLLGLWPRYLGYVVSFLVIGNYWLAHRRMFRHVVRFDGALVWLNLLFLMTIAFLPFPSGLLGEYGDERPVVSLYAGVLSITGLLSTAMWVYATHGRRLVEPDIDARIVRVLTLRALSVPVVFLISIGLAFFSPSLAMAAWGLLIVTRLIAGRRGLGD